MSAATATKEIANNRQRKPVVGPSVVTEDMSVFEYLRQCQPPLDKKLIEIACSQSKVPHELRDDAAQEIAIMWAGLKPDTDKYKPGQIASYAHRMACHAALRLRRDLGSAVRLPGSAFRKRRDGSSYVSPGVLAEAIDWSAVEQWYEMNDANVDAGYASSMPTYGNDVDFSSLNDEPAAEAEDAETATQRERMQALDACKDALTQQQYGIMKALIEGSTYEEILAQFGVKKGVLMREISIACSMMGPMDAYL